MILPTVIIYSLYISCHTTIDQTPTLTSHQQNKHTHTYPNNMLQLIPLTLYHIINQPHITQTTIAKTITHNTITITTMLQHFNILTVQLTTINKPNTTLTHHNKLQHNRTKNPITYYTSIHIPTP